MYIMDMYIYIVIYIYLFIYIVIYIYIYIISYVYNGYVYLYSYIYIQLYNHMPIIYDLWYMIPSKPQPIPKGACMALARSLDQGDVSERKAGPLLWME